MNGMGITEIILLIIGAGVFAASFILPEKKRKASEGEAGGLSQKQIKEMVEKELEGTREKISGIVEETITYGVEKTERSLDRLTNEKIMAVNEYSDTVLGEIHRNHEEVVFLYDMLNDKQKNLKDTVIQVEKTAKAVKETVKETAKETAKETVKGNEKSEEESNENFLRLKPEQVMADSLPNAEKKIEEAAEKAEEKTEGRQRKKPGVKKNPGTKKKEGSLPDVSLSFGQSGAGGRNNNERILALHKEGKSNMVIARELGLGIGEVKLVIDLFEGI